MLTTARLLGRSLHEEHAGCGVDQPLQSLVEILFRDVPRPGSPAPTGPQPLHLIGQLRGMRTIQPVNLLTALRVVGKQINKKHSRVSSDRLRGRKKKTALIF